MSETDALLSDPAACEGDAPPYESDPTCPLSPAEKSYGAGFDGGEGGASCEDARYAPKGTSLVACYCNLATATVGAGILSYPAAMRDAGVVPTALLTAAFGALNAFTLILLMRMATARNASLRLHTFEELVGSILGRRAYFGAVFVILFNTIGALTGFLVVIADIGQPLFERWITLDHGHSFLTSRTFVVLCFAVAVALPLSMAGNLHSLAVSSFLAVASVLLVAVVIVFRSGEAMSAASSALPSDARLFGTGVQVVLTIPIAVFALGCHLQIVPTHGSLREDRRQGLDVVVWCTVATCGLLYILTGFAGYAQFGSATKGNILENYAVDDTLVNVARLIMALHISLAYPVALYPMRRAVDLLVLRGGRGMPTRARTFVQNAAVVGLTSLLAILVPQVDTVFGFVGASSGVAITFGLPALAWLRAARMGLLPPSSFVGGPRAVPLAKCLVVFSLAVGAVSVGVNIYNHAK
eukprot:Opistho-1_new@86744